MRKQNIAERFNEIPNQHFENLFEIVPLGLAILPRKLLAKDHYYEINLMLD